MAKGDSPTAPDPYSSADAQYEFGTAAADYNAALNRVDTTSPTGTTAYQIEGYDPQTGAPIYSQNTTLSTPEQGILNSSEGLQQGQLNTGQNLLDQFNTASAAGAPKIPGVQYSASGAPVQTSLNTSNVPGIQDVSSLEQSGQSTALAGEMAALQPGLDQQREQLDSSLRNSGAHPGDPAYDNAMNALDQDQASQKTQAAGAAITAGTGLQNTNYGEEANTNQQIFGEDQSKMASDNTGAAQQFSQNVTNANLNNTGGQTALANYAQQMNIPLNELESLLGGSQVSTPSAVAPGTATVSTPDIMSAFTNQYNGQLASYNADVATTNSEVGDAATLATLGYLASAASDRRVKKDIRRAGATSTGIPAYQFRYVWDDAGSPLRVGVMADEVEQVLPHAVSTHPMGFKMVDYSQVGELPAC